MVYSHGLKIDFFPAIIWDSLCAVRRCMDAPLEAGGDQYDSAMQCNNTITLSQRRPAHEIQ